MMKKKVWKFHQIIGCAEMLIYIYKKEGRTESYVILETLPSIIYFATRES